MLPRRVTPGATYLITRRCTQRQFLLRPERKVNGAFLYCLAYAAEKNGIEIHAYVALSNHHHVVATDPEGRICEFIQCFHLLLTRSMNALRGRFGSMFDCSQTICVRAVEAEDVLRQLVYTFCNPVSSGLVPRAKEWPGARSRPSQFGETVLAERPGWFFSGKMPDVVPLKIVRPASFANRSDEEFPREVEEAVEEREAGRRSKRRDVDFSVRSGRSRRSQPIRPGRTKSDGSSRRRFRRNGRVRGWRRSGRWSGSARDTGRRSSSTAAA